jgi:MSHA pilin protein MshC
VNLKTQAGFTFAELLIVMLLVGILSFVAIPRLFDSNAFAARGTRDFVAASLRYAQKAAIAMRRNVCVSAGTTVMTVTYASSAGSGQSCAAGNTLRNPANGQAFGAAANAYPNGTTLAASSSLVFDAFGRPLSASFVPLAGALNITVNGYATPVVVEAETGYVH